MFQLQLQHFVFLLQPTSPLRERKKQKTSGSGGTLEQVYSTTFNKDPVAKVEACRGPITPEKNINDKQTQVTRTKHEVTYCSTSQLVGEIAFLVSYQFFKFRF